MTTTYFLYLLAAVCVSAGGLAIFIGKEFDDVRRQLSETQRLLKEIAERN